MRVLIACEYTQIVTEAFAMAGHDVLSCDYERPEKGLPHYRGDVRDLLKEPWDLVIGFPPCTFLAKAQIHLLRKEPGRAFKAFKGYHLFMDIMNANSKRVAIENPQGIMQRWYRMFDQQVQPYFFGDSYRKEICLWLRGLPLLKPTKLVTPVRTMKNHTNGRMTQKQRGLIKSRFYPGIAAAMAAQWGTLNDAWTSAGLPGDKPATTGRHLEDLPGTLQGQPAEELRTTRLQLNLFDHE